MVLKGLKRNISNKNDEFDMKSMTLTSEIPNCTCGQVEAVAAWN